MKVLRVSLALATLLTTAAVHAASIDMEDPRRLLGREGDVRIDAQLVRDTVTQGSPIGYTYQIQNLTAAPVAIAHKVMDASYDEDTRTITLSVGSEVPPDGDLPQMILIAPGEKRVLQASGNPRLTANAMRTAFATLPRYVQVKVAILRDVRPFLPLIEKQDARTRQRLSDELFEKWFECNDSIYLNAVPVRYSRPGGNEEDQRLARGGF
jgi:hypothetical protein